MNKIFRNNQNLTNLCILILVIFCSNLAKAQPGWQDFTKRYFYTVLDENGHEISFKNNKDYRIMIDTVLYKTPNIPNDSIKPAKENYNWDKGYVNQIRINDFSMVNYQNDYFQSEKQLEIKIIHKKDTMYIRQPSGIGSKRVEWLDINGIKSGHKIIPKTDFTLRFIAGHYYFPKWSSEEILNAEISGNVKIANANQRHFIVPKTLYDSLSFTNDISDWEIRRKLIDRADKKIADKFINEYFSVEKTIEPAEFENPLPYKEPRWATHYMNSAKEDNVYFGYITYYKDSLGNYTNKKVFSRYNYKENTVKHWFPSNPIFDESFLFVDTFNNLLYQKGLSYRKHLSEKGEHIPPRQYIYQSADAGKTWKENKSMSELFTHYDFQNIRFLDNEYAITFNTRNVKHKKTKHEIRQITHYLLKNMQVIDSLEIPNNVVYHYSNYFTNQSPFSTKDTIVIGSWKTNKNSNDGNLKSFKFATIFNNNGKWNFSTSLDWDDLYPKYAIAQTKNPNDTIKEYQNFKLINKQVLVFKNGSGSLKLKNTINEFEIVEQGEQIYLVYRFENFRGVLFSFDGGTHWYLYPQNVGKEYGWHSWNDYRLLNIEDQGGISHFESETLDKIFHKFTPK